MEQMHVQRSAAANAALANSHWTARIELRQIEQEFTMHISCHGRRAGQEGGGRAGAIG
jgi:hypothetical protein